MKTFKLREIMQRGNIGEALDLIDKAEVLPEKDEFGTHLINVPIVVSNEIVGAAVLKRLIDRGCPVDRVEFGDKNCLHLAAEYGRTSLVPALLAAGADIEHRSHSGNSPLHAAVTRKRDGIVHLLLEAGANPNAQNSSGRTPAFALLFVCGNPIFNSGRALDYLLEGKIRRILALLRHFGADLSIPDVSGQSPADLLRQELSAQAHLELILAHERSIRRLKPKGPSRATP